MPWWDHKKKVSAKNAGTFFISIYSPDAISNMKLEFLDDISDGGRYPQVISESILRLYDFDTREAAEFKRLVQEMISQERKEINLESLEFIIPVNCN